MRENALQPRKSLNKAFLKVKPIREEIEIFKSNLIKLLDQINEAESEEFHKNLISDFLKNTYYSPNHFLNTKGRNDLVIHNGKDAKSSVGVILEAKKPTNKSEMLKIDNLNVKAFQELILYFLRDRVAGKNLEIRYLIATNIYEWFIFDANIFEQYFAQNKALVKQFTDFEERRLTGKTTDFFYKQIAEPEIAKIHHKLEFTYFDIRYYEDFLKNTEAQDDRELIALFKLLSPEHLLKLPFTNDSNSLNKTFYSELLHIIGLAETKESGKKLIGRKTESERNIGSLVENAINQLDSLDKISRLEKPSQFGDTDQERLFNVGLELAITWINRILFLKLLEAQLIKYHRNEKLFSFLNLEKVQNYDDLNRLFFNVLARKQNERNESVKKIFENVPYLNSSLFEPTDIEQLTIVISNLRDESLPIFSSTVLKDGNGKRRTGKLNALAYLFDFLDSYDFSSEGSEDIQEENKTLINASVLGLIFEKINGYKDGSFFTPGFITMYMCRETIRRAVVQKFNEMKGWDSQDVDQLYDKIVDKKEANEIINSLKICDPAVGSGHFLVSALNEMIAIKSELKILLDREGKTLRDYHIEVVNDELIVTDDDEQLFEYNPKNRESQRIQEALFHEKQTIIENCLFGVDINPNSVKICRLRLWIEMLKNAYYKVDNELETLPNIDINIKCGNSLISRFALGADLRSAVGKNKYSVDSYRNAVQTYRNAESKEQKREMESLINDIKRSLKITLQGIDPNKTKLRRLEGEVESLEDQTSLLEPTKEGEKAKDKKIAKLTNEIDKLRAEIEDIESGRIYENALEWRFEFPEVLNNDGDFVGFDVITGNPPYGAMLSKAEKEFMKIEYSEYHTRWSDTFNYFIGKSISIAKYNSYICLIIPNNFLFQNEYEKSRRKIIEEFTIDLAINLGGGIFDDAEVPTSILLFKKTAESDYCFNYSDLRSFDKNSTLFHSMRLTEFSKHDILSTQSLVFGVDKLILSLRKRNFGEIKLIDDIASDVANGIQPTGDSIFRVTIAKSSQLNLEKNILKNVLVGRDFDRYIIHKSYHKIIYTIKSININDYPNCLSYLNKFKNRLEAKRETKKGILPWWCLHWPRSKELFEEDKIIIRQTADHIISTLDIDSYYVLNNAIVLKVKEEYKLQFDYKFLVAILNSKLINYIYKQLTQEDSRTFAEVKPKNLRKLPVICAAPHQRKVIMDIVTQILFLKKSDSNADTTTLEQEIDQMVYQLYGLTEKEIKIIEENMV